MIGGGRLNVAPNGAGGMANLFDPAVPNIFVDVVAVVGVVTVELGREDENVVVDGCPIVASAIATMDEG